MMMMMNWVQIMINYSLLFYLVEQKLILYLIEMPFNNFANRVDPDQAALIRAA